MSFDDAENAGQTILQGMGELQFEIIKDRLKREYKLNAYFGPLNIGYKESPTVEHTESYVLQKVIGDKRINVDVTLHVQPTLNDTEFRTVRLDKFTSDNGISELSYEFRRAVNHGVQSAVNRGVLLRYPVVNVDVYLKRLICSANVPLPYVSSAAFLCTLNALRNAESVIIQPVMKLDVSYNSTPHHIAHSTKILNY